MVFPHVMDLSVCFFPSESSFILRAPAGRTGGQAGRVGGREAIYFARSLGFFFELLLCTVITSQ
jgi:hypothetical protein